MWAETSRYLLTASSQVPNNDKLSMMPLIPHSRSDDNRLQIRRRFADIPRLKTTARIDSRLATIVVTLTARNATCILYNQLLLKNSRCSPVNAEFVDRKSLLLNAPMSGLRSEVSFNE